MLLNISDVHESGIIFVSYKWARLSIIKHPADVCRIQLSTLGTAQAHSSGEMTWNVKTSTRTLYSRLCKKKSRFFSFRILPIISKTFQSSARYHATDLGFFRLWCLSLARFAWSRGLNFWRTAPLNWFGMSPDLTISYNNTTALSPFKNEDSKRVLHPARDRAISVILLQ